MYVTKNNAPVKTVFTFRVRILHLSHKPAKLNFSMSKYSLTASYYLKARDVFFLLIAIFTSLLDLSLFREHHAH